MKRFYKLVSVEAVAPGPGFLVHLDARPVKTPSRQELCVPSPHLAAAIANEWRGQGADIVPQSMPLTRLACGALDRVASGREQVIDEIAGYAATDMLCYRADHPDALVRRQHDTWQPILDWMAKRYDAAFVVTAGVIPVTQPRASLDAVRDAVAAHDDMALSALHAVTHASGSVVLALALAEARLDAESVIAASQLDERYQTEQWGEDTEAGERRDELARQINDSARFFALLNGQSEAE